MSNLGKDALEINNLVETLRHEPHTPAVQSKSIQALFTATTARSSEGQRGNEADIKAVFDSFDTRHPAHNAQRSYALKTLTKAKYKDLDLERDADLIKEIILEIDARKIAIKPLVATATLAGLSARLSDYSTITSNNTIDFPHLELLGHRRDIAENAVFTKPASAGTLRNEQKHRANLAGIDASLDEIVPRGSHYNKHRQFVIDTLLRHKDGLAAWSTNDKAANASRARSGSTGFIANNAHYRAEEAAQPIRAMLQAMKVEHSQEIGPAKAFTSQAIVRIATLISAHRGTIHQPSEQPNAKRQKLSPSALNHVPYAIAAAVAITPLKPPALQAGTQMMAVEAVKAVNKIIVPRRGNFQSRAHFLTTVFQHRADLREGVAGNSAREHSNPNNALERLKSSYRQAFETKRGDIAQLAEKLHSYHIAWHAGVTSSRNQAATGEGPAASNQKALTPQAAARPLLDERSRQISLQR